MKTLRLLPVTLLLAGCPDPEPTDSTRSLIILHTNDEHSHVIGHGPESDDFPPPATAGTGMIKGGLARRAAVLQKERDAAKEAKADTLTLSGGDNSQGTLMQVPFATTAPDFKLMGQIGYNASCLGNHEFDFGPKALAAGIKNTQGATSMHHVATNIQFSDADPGDDDLKALFDESGTDMAKPLHRTLLLTTPNGLKVGLIGVLGPLAATYAPLKGPVTFSLPAGAKENEIDKVMAQMFIDLQKGVDHLRNDLKADVVIAMSHSGVDTTDMTKGDDYKIATNVTGIDAIVSGHTHTRFPAMLVTNPKNSKQVLIQQTGSYGEALGKFAIKVDAAGAVTFDMAQSKLIDIDDRIVANDPVVNAQVDAVIKDLEGSKVIMGKSFLEHTLSAIEGAAVADDPGKVGDLYFRPIGKVPFAMPGAGSFRESPVSVLIADAELATADAVGPTDVSVIALGVVRSGINKGKTDLLSFADVFRILPLGLSPADGSVGYPLTRFAIWPVELKAALELMAGYAYHSEDTSTYYLVTGGMKVEYDTSRPEAVLSDPAKLLDPNYGRITKITVATNHAMPDMFDKVVFELPGGWVAPINNFGPNFTVVTSLYIASYAGVNGITLKHPTTGATITLNEAIMKRGDGTEMKEWESLASYIRAFPSGGTLPTRYDPAMPGNFPRRMICTGPICAK
jgi:5'-nucleotidase / UDP-sugar diphosphatase